VYIRQALSLFRLRATGVAQRHSVWRAQVITNTGDKSKQHILTNRVFVSFCGAKISEKSGCITPWGLAGSSLAWYP